VNEGIRLAVIPLDEAEALHGVEELNCSAGFLARELTLRSAAARAAGTAAAAFDRHRFAFDTKVGRRDPAATIDEGELKRLAVGQIRQAGLLDRRDVNEDVLTAIVANDEAEALLRVEEFDDALAFADDLGRHPATAAATKAAAATTAAEATASTAAVAAAAAAEAAAVTETTAATAIATATAAALLVSKISAEGRLVAETVALVAAASAAVPLAPFIETHAPSELKKSPPTPETNALGPHGATGHGA
jgi:hypothetical protein